uniref:Uncharacterized protein n=1 Tax=viral metagenome TaxID=1070528 RepID=A0A6M3M756_9ZZZZ
MNPKLRYHVMRPSRTPGQKYDLVATTDRLSKAFKWVDTYGLGARVFDTRAWMFVGRPRTEAK